MVSSQREGQLGDVGPRKIINYIVDICCIASFSDHGFDFETEESRVRPLRVDAASESLQSLSEHPLRRQTPRALLFIADGAPLLY